MPQTLRCPRDHPVPFTDDDRGGEVYCPVCGVACPVPEAGPQPALAGPGQLLQCRNGHTVPFTEDDRGGEVYCRTCGVACQVPEADPQPAAAARGGRVFSAAGESQIVASIVGRVPCPRCEQPVPYTVADYGETVYCTKCGAAVAVGESLHQAVAARAPAGPAETATTPVRVPRRRRARLVVGSLLLFGGLAAGGAFVSWRYPESMPFDATVLPWNKALIAGSGTAAPDPTPPQPAPPVLRPDEKIKPEMIDRLLTRADVAAALADAQTWAGVLDRYNVPPADPRRAALARVIPVLQKKLQELRPGQVAATPVERCLEWLDKMQDALRAKDIPAARKAAAEAEAVMNADPKAGKRFAARFARQQAWLAELMKAQQSSPAAKRAADVERLLNDALALARDGKVTEAMETRARALILAPRAAIDPYQAKRLTEQVKDLTTVIVRARGKRAVADAEACAREGDDEALRVLVGEARRDLPEFTKEADFRAAFDRAEKLAGQRAPQAAGSAFGRRVLFRHDYERGLDAFREGNVLAGVEAMDRARGSAPDDDARRRVIDLTAGGLEAAIRTLDGDDPARRAAARTATDRAKPWVGDARWQELDALLRAGDPKPAGN